MSVLHNSDFRASLRDRVLVCDGATGSMLLARGVPSGSCLEEWNLSASQLVQDVHEAYRAAGADILQTNTFGANAMRLARFGLQKRCREINEAAVQLARAAAGDECFVAGSVGPLGLPATGRETLPPSQARESFEEQISALASAGADLIVLETFVSLNETEEAVAAAHAVCDLPLVVQFTPSDSGGMLDGTALEVFAERAAEWGVDAVGCNCGTGPKTMLEAVRRLSAHTSLPLAAQPSAGLPTVLGEEELDYPYSAEMFAALAEPFLQCGVRILGGCCGTTPDHIQLLRRVLNSFQPATFGARDRK